MTYEVRVADTVRKNLRRVPDQDKQRILDALKALAHDPRPHGCVALRVRTLYRIRIGDYRALYDVNDGARVVTVLTVKHRRDVYRDL